MAAVRRAGDRFRTTGSGRETWHAFSFGDHYDPARISFGLLLACNEDRLEPGSGYDAHEHRDVEIVTWVLAGDLHHDDSYGHRGVVAPGQVQVLSAGSGVTHSEHAGTAAPVHLLQMWLPTDAPGLTPAYARADVSAPLGAGGWVALAGGRAEDEPAVAIRQQAACLRAARLDGGSSLPLPAAPFVYLHVTRGAVTLDGCGDLHAGDAAMVGDSVGRLVTAAAAAEVLAWEMRPGWPASPPR